MVEGSVTRPVETMTERDTINAFIDGSKKSAYAARDLAKETNNPEWANVAITLEAMAMGGKELFDMKAMSRFETMMACDLKANPKGFIN